MVDFEKGSPAWDIGMILTRHMSQAAGSAMTCARVASLQRTAGPKLTGAERFRMVNNIPCTCGAGISDIERTSLRKQRKESEDGNAAGIDG